MHEARTDFDMLLGSLYLLIAGAGTWSTTTKPGSSPGTAIVPQSKCEPINAGLIKTQWPI